MITFIDPTWQRKLAAADFNHRPAKAPQCASSPRIGHATVTEHTATPIRTLYIAAAAVP